jgi:hypothetical protein
LSPREALSSLLKVIINVITLFPKHYAELG